jgi:transposase
MDRYIGLDAHATTCTVAVIGPSGRRLRNDVVETNGRALVSYMKLVPGHKHLVLEEGTQSEWLYEILQPHVDSIVVTRAERNTGAKSDAIDAFALAEALRVGAIKMRVSKDRGAFGALRELERTHWKITNDYVRSMNRLRAIFRSRAIDSESLIRANQKWDELVKKLPMRMRAAAATLHDEAEVLKELRDRAEEEMLSEAKKHKMWRILQTCPGLGAIRVAQLLSIIVSPARFRTSRQLWAYSGLAVVTRSSNDWQKDAQGRWNRKSPMTRGLNNDHNRAMKCIFVGAAMTVIQRAEGDPLNDDYKRLVASGTKPNLAKLTIARKIAAITLAMWKREEVYAPAKYRSQL